MLVTGVGILGISIIMFLYIIIGGAGKIGLMSQNERDMYRKISKISQADRSQEEQEFYIKNQDDI